MPCPIRRFREGYRDPVTGKYTVSLWQQGRWTNNKGTIELTRTGVRVFAFREQRVGGTSFYAVNPADIVELKSAPEIDTDESSVTNTKARRMTLRGSGETHIGPLNRVLVVVSYEVPEMDYFSPKALPFLEDLVNRSTPRACRSTASTPTRCTSSRTGDTSTITTKGSSRSAI